MSYVLKKKLSMVINDKTSMHDVQMTSECEHQLARLITLGVENMTVVRIVVSLVTYVLLTGCATFGFDPASMAAHKEYCSTYQGTQYNCLTPHPRETISIRMPDGSVEWVEKSRVRRVDAFSP